MCLIPMLGTVASLQPKTISEQHFAVVASVSVLTGVYAPSCRPWSFFEAWNRHDVPAMFALYTKDAQVVNSLGLWWRGAAELERGLRQMNAIGPPLRPDSMSARRVTGDTAICIVDYTVAASRALVDSRCPNRKRYRHSSWCVRNRAG
jgi:ketosteroid isomerase-like protein